MHSAIKWPRVSKKRAGISWFEIETIRHALYVHLDGAKSNTGSGAVRFGRNENTLKSFM